MSKKQQIISTNAIISTLVPGGQGITTLPDGKKAFLWNALPGEIVEEFIVTKKKSRYLEGVATRISSPSPHRITPADECYLSTSPWQIMNYDYELAMKTAILEETLRQHRLSSEIGKFVLAGVRTAAAGEAAPSAHGDGPDGRVGETNLPISPTVRTNNEFFHYRNKMEYALYFSHNDEQIHLAFHQRGSHRKIPIKESSLERPEIFAKATAIVDELNAERAEARNYQSLLLRCNQDGEVSGGLYVNHQPHPDFPPLKDTILGHTYSYSPNGFFQINLPVYELALAEIKKHIQTDNVLDLYAGVGTIGLSVARDRDLTLVEIDKSAYRELERNCREFIEEGDNILAGVRTAAAGEAAPSAHGDGPDGRVGDMLSSSSTHPHPVLSKSEEALSYISPDQTVILDPPRAGCAPQLLDKLLEVEPPTIIYLSCNPATQARDLALLTKSDKYDIIEVIPFNFFPRTPHLENLVILNHS